MMTITRIVLGISVLVVITSCGRDEDDSGLSDNTANSYLSADIDGETYEVENMDVTYTEDDPYFGEVLKMKDLGSTEKNLSIGIVFLDEGQSQYGLDLTLVLDNTIYSAVANDKLKLEVTTYDPQEKKMIGTFQAELNTTEDTSTVEIRNGVFNAYYD